MPRANVVATYCLKAFAFILVAFWIADVQPAAGQVPVVPEKLSGEKLAALKREYVQFAEQFSMRTDSGYFEKYRLEAPDRAEVVQTLKLSHPDLKAAAAEFPRIAAMYATAQRLINGARSTPEETARMQKLFWQGREGDDDKMKTYMEEAFKGFGNQFAAVIHSTKLMDEAMPKHAAAWKAIVPLAAQFSGSQKIDAPLGFVYLSVRKSTQQPDLSVINSSGKHLTNVTLVVESNISRSLRNEARKNYIFVRSWNDGEEIRINFALVDMFSRVGPPRPTKQCLTYSIWSDQTTQTDVVLDMRTPEPEDRGGGFYGCPFSKEGERPPLGPDLLKVGSKWTGEVRTLGFGDNVSFDRIALVVTEREGDKFKAKISGDGPNGIVEGTVDNGAINWRKAAKQQRFRDEPGPPMVGEMNGRRIEVRFDGSFGASGRRKGTMSLELGE